MSKTVKLRPCPALAREITAADCRDNRGSNYHCPASCRYNPFAPDNYLALLKVERKLSSRWFPWLLKDAADAKAVQKELEQVVKTNSRHGLHQFVMWNLFFKRDAAGLTSAQRWEKAGFPGLKNDERVLMRCQMQTRVALLEAHRVVDLYRVEAVDVLSPKAEALTLMDRSLASSAPRFGAYVVWAFPLPHFWRLSGMAVLLPDMTPIEPAEIVRALAEYGGAPPDEAAMRLWLAQHFEEFIAGLDATSLARRKRLFESSDVQIGKAVYELKAPFAECRELLESFDEVHASPLSPGEKKEGVVAAYLWFDTKEEANQDVPIQGSAVLGRIATGQSHWRLEAIGASRLTELRNLFEERMAQRVSFQGERRDDVALQVLQHDPKFDPALVPPRLLESIGQLLVGSSISAAIPTTLTGEEALSQLMEARQKAQLHRPVPCLQGKSPIEAARIPELRPRLIQLMKSRIRNLDEQNLLSGRNDDFNWALKELGLEEISFAPPPQRTAPETAAAEVDEGPAARPRFARPPAPLLPEAPLTVQETMQRLDALMDLYEEFDSAKAELAASGATALQDMETILSDLLNERELSFLRPFLVQAWFVMVAPGTQPPEIEFQGLLDAFDDAVVGVHESLSNTNAGPEALNEFVQSASQPGIADVLLKALLTAVVEAPKSSRPRTKTTPAMMAAVVALIEEVDRHMHGGAEAESEPE